MAFFQFPLSDYEMNQISIIEQRLNQSNGVLMLSDEELNACLDAIDTMKRRGFLIDYEADNANIYRIKGSFAEFKKWIQSQNDKAKQAVRGGEMHIDFEPLTKNCEQLLQDILDHRDAEGNCDTDYWKYRFEGITSYEGKILRSQFGVLRDKKMISVFWADNIPYVLNVLELGLSYFDYKKSVLSLNLIGAKNTVNSKRNKEYDVFISHASKDKLSYVDELFNAVRRLGIRVFYDTEEIAWGDNWKQTILNGTERSEFAIIVISSNFFGREWTERELSQFLNKQNISGQKVVLPLLVNVSVAEMVEHYPLLADIQVIDTASRSIEDIVILFAKELIKRLREK